jgi:IS30 family transposase
MWVFGSLITVYSSLKKAPCFLHLFQSYSPFAVTANAEASKIEKEIGHWESDTIIGGNHLGVLVTHVDKASKFLVAGLGKNKTSKQMNEVTEELFKPMDKEKIKTFTCDEVKEFSGHEELSKVLSASFYFATPYHSWERGLNEHTNF